ncbi:MAG TPA: iron-containing redox enzyme family protein [Coleofasciculaceae cyanobacterium]|jgi:hypothetical protein
MTIALTPDRPINGISKTLLSSAQTAHYTKAEKQFIQLLRTENLDQRVSYQPELMGDFSAALTDALKIAYSESSSSDAVESAQLFLQRILYQINRLNFFWYGDLLQYQNERSYYLQQVRDSIEAVWQPWELAHLNVDQLQRLDVKQALIDRCEADLQPALSDSKRYIQEQMTLEGYRHLIAIASLDGLVESSRLCNILGGASNEIQATLIRVLIEEYGNGRLPRKHSTFFAQMMRELELRSEPETYLDLVPWQVLACINHNFLLTECKRHFLRYIGGFTYFEIVGPSVYRDYMKAAQRLNLSDTAMGYWELHIREDERHGQWMLHDVALALADHYPEQAWELVLGYDQDKWMGDRAGKAVIQMIQQAEQSS